MPLKMTLHLENQQSDDQETFHLLVMGDPGVGKRTLISGFMKAWTLLGNQSLKKADVNDIGTEGRDLTVEIKETSVKTNFPSFQSLPSCDAFLLVYSLVDDDSFQSVSDARDQILQEKGPNVPIVFVANKTDIADSVDKTERVYRDLNISCEWEHGHVEVSAEKDQSFSSVVQQIIKCYNKSVAGKLKEEPRQSLKEKFQSLKNFLCRKIQKK